MKHLRLRGLTLAGILAGGLGIAAYSVNPATGQWQLSLIGERQELQWTFVVPMVTDMLVLL